MLLQIYRTWIFCILFTVDPVYTRPPEGGLCPSGDFPDNWMEYNGYCYLFATNVETLLFQDAARVQCKSRGAELVSIHSDEETDYILKHLGTTNLHQWIGLVRAASSELIFLRDLAVDVPTCTNMRLELKAIE